MSPSNSEPVFMAMDTEPVLAVNIKVRVTQTLSSLRFRIHCHSHSRIQCHVSVIAVVCLQGAPLNPWQQLLQLASSAAAVNTALSTQSATNTLGTFFCILIARAVLFVLKRHKTVKCVFWVCWFAEMLTH